MSKPMSVKVSGRYQISLPSHARQELNIEAGDRLLVDVQDGLLILIPQPADYVTHMEGLYADVWQNVNSTTYLNEEREAWQTSENS